MYRYTCYNRATWHVQRDNTLIAIQVKLRMLHLQATFDRLINLDDLTWRSDEKAKTFYRLNSRSYI